MRDAETIRTIVLCGLAALALLGFALLIVTVLLVNRAGTRFGGPSLPNPPPPTFETKEPDIVELEARVSRIEGELRAMGRLP